MIPITGATGTVGVIGDPVRHSLSPILHNAAFAAMDVDLVSAAYEVPTGSGADAVAAMRTMGIRGLSVTMPHKMAVAAAADDRSASVEALGAANCLVNDEGVVTAHNTDGDGFVRGLLVEHGVDIDERRVVVVGAGGAAKAVIEAVVRAGADEVVVVNRSEATARAAVEVAVRTRRGAASDIAAADIVVNATPVGMADRPGLPIDPDLLRLDQVVVDLVYHPLRTELLVVAERAGAVAIGGLPMLLHQAAIQVELWTGITAPIDAMRNAIAGQLGRR